ncbi:MAG: hypothetical protein M3Y77_00705, partial [Actinomycetota bacterium]|nr:hypothetical protein [Actinomycetota bacterium]
LGCGPCGSRPSRRGCDRTSRGDRCGDGVPHLLGGQRHRPGTGQSEQSEIAATAGDLLLWLYGRVTLDTGSVDDALLGRFRRLCFTD